jgi:hypothetical protein
MGQFVSAPAYPPERARGNPRYDAPPAPAALRGTIVTMIPQTLQGSGGKCGGRPRTSIAAADCRSLSANDLARVGAFAGPGARGRVGNVAFAVEWHAGGCRVLLTVEEEPPIAVAVTFTPMPRRAGCRPWLSCPLEVAGHACGRRAGKLFVPPGRRLFGCRHCWRLVYRRRANRVLSVPRSLS